MLCDDCSEREATIHEVVINHGKKLERHLCEQCAAEAGVGVPGQAQVSQLLSNFVVARPAKKQGGGVRCEHCGMTFAEFRQSQLLGCEHCYEAFEDRLGPLLERVHEGGTHHVGKTPTSIERSARTPDEDDDPSHRIAGLREQLRQAINAEHYERAAALRDEISKVLGGGAGGDEPA